MGVLETFPQLFEKLGMMSCRQHNILNLKKGIGSNKFLLLVGTSEFLHFLCGLGLGLV